MGAISGLAAAPYSYTSLREVHSASVSVCSEAGGEEKAVNGDERDGDEPRLFFGAREGERTVERCDGALDVSSRRGAVSRGDDAREVDGTELGVERRGSYHVLHDHLRGEILIDVGGRHRGRGVGIPVEGAGWISGMNLASPRGAFEAAAGKARAEEERKSRRSGAHRRLDGFGASGCARARRRRGDS